MPLQAAECCSNKSPDAPIIFSFFVNSFHFLLFFSAWKCAMRLVEHSLPACLWTACMPWACPRRRSFFAFFKIYICLPLFTQVMSRLLPLSRLQYTIPWREVGQEGAWIQRWGYMCNLLDGSDYAWAHTVYGVTPMQLHTIRDREAHTQSFWKVIIKTSGSNAGWLTYTHHSYCIYCPSLIVTNIFKHLIP